MNNMQDNQDHFNVLREIDKSNKSTQRQLAGSLGFSLVPQNSENKKELWRYCISSGETNPLIHFVTISSSRPNTFDLRFKDLKMEVGNIL